MRKLAFLSVAFALVAVSFYGCDETNPTEPVADAVAAEAPSTFNADFTGPLKRLVHEYYGRNFTVAAGGYAEVQVRCPSGMWAVGGGATTNSSDWVLQKSRPGNYLNDLPTAWWAKYKNITASTQTAYIEALVICLSAGGNGVK